MRLFIIPFTQKKAEPPKAEAEAEEKKESPKKESKLNIEASQIQRASCELALDNSAAARSELPTTM